MLWLKIKITVLSSLTFSVLVWKFLSSLSQESWPAWPAAKIDFVLNNPLYVEPPKDDAA